MILYFKISIISMFLISSGLTYFISSSRVYQFEKYKLGNVMIKSQYQMVIRDENGYEIKPKEWFNGLSSDPGASLTDPRAVPEECRKFVESIKKDEIFYNSITYQQTIDFIDKHYVYFAVPFKCGDIIYEPNVKTGAAKIFSFGLMTQMNEKETLRLFGEYYRDLKPTDDRPNVRNFIEYGWKGISFTSGLAIVSKLQAYDDTETALSTQAVIEGGSSWDIDSDSWIP